MSQRNWWDDLALVCGRCGQEYPPTTFEWCCIRCGGLLELEDLPAFDPAAINTSANSLWRYEAFLPVPGREDPVTLGEGWTPLVPLRQRKDGIFCKLDFLMPSGSFKDRGSSVLVTALRAMGIRQIVEDSSGNAAASLAAYSARAGLDAEIFVPAHASPMKLAQIRVYGANLNPVEGPRENSALAAQDVVVNGRAYYASHYYNPFALLGMQTTAWEIWEQLGGRAPHNLIVPVGHGTNFVGLFDGFSRLASSGLIGKLPRFFAAQAERVAPLKLAFERGESEPVQVEPSVTAAEGIAITKPIRGHQILQAVHESDGGVVSATEEEIAMAQAELATNGIFVEPTSATAYAGLQKLSRKLVDKQVTVVSLTGSGLKSQR